ncbi:MAG: hypothetical protein IMY72_06615 [Bacteroidetes bacterium]|nr:hypothetical protein [Bacteroidota bacterium]
MKTLMRTICLAVLVIPFMLNDANAQSRRKIRKLEWGSKYNYEINCLGVGNDGTKIFKVWAFDKKVDVAVRKAKSHAISACIFRGIPAGGGADRTPAIITSASAEEKNAEYFDKFFAPGGRYLGYVNLSSDGYPKGKDKIKMKKGYKVGIIVSIDFDRLRKDLEKDGVARGLSSGF